jgi:hypothetical protein
MADARHLVRQAARSGTWGGEMSMETADPGQDPARPPGTALTLDLAR